MGVGTDDPNAHLHIQAEGAYIDTGVARNYPFEIHTTATAANQKETALLMGVEPGSPGFAWIQSANPGYTIADLVMQPEGSAHVARVGIGTKMPTQKLHVAGNVRGDQLCIGADCRSEWPAGSGSNDRWTLTGSDVYRGSGKVGIGISAPVARHHSAALF